MCPPRIPVVKRRLFPSLCLIAATLLAGIASAAPAGPVAAPGFSLELLRRPDAIFSGLGRDGDAVVVGNLSDGRLYRLSAAGDLAAFGPALPHGPDVIGDPTGPYRAERSGDHYLVAQGWTPSDAEEGPYDHALLKIDAAGSVVVLSGDFWNPFDFVVTGDTLIVVDAARNSIERLGPGGARTTLFVFPRLAYGESALADLSPTEFSGGDRVDIDAVPTGAALAGDRLYVALFTGFPFIAGAGEIVSLPLSGEPPAPRREASALNAPVDVALAADGGLLVLEHGTYDQGRGFVPESGRLIAIDRATGKRMLLLDRLTRPASLLVRPDGSIIVACLDGTLAFLTSQREGN